MPKCFFTKSKGSKPRSMARASGWCDLDRFSASLRASGLGKLTRCELAARVASSCDAPALRQFSRGRRPTMGSRFVGDNPTKDHSGHLLETNFWDSEESEDEGIGSDDSVEQADMSPSGESPVKSFNWGLDSGKSRRRGMGGILTQIRKSLQGKTEVTGLVFGVGLGELVNSEGGKVPRLVSWATEVIEERGGEACEGIYRLSLDTVIAVPILTRQSAGYPANRAQWPPSKLQLMRGRNPVKLILPAPTPLLPCSKSVKQIFVILIYQLLQLFFRELPEPLCTYSLHRALVRSVSLCAGETDEVLSLLVQMPEPHLDTLAHLMRHLHCISLSSTSTGMTPRNLAIVWAPNLLRAPPSLNQEALTDEIRDIGAQARLVELLISKATSLFPKKKRTHCRRRTSGEEESLWKKVRIQLGVCAA